MSQIHSHTRKSSMSQHSRSLCQFINDADLLTDEELIKQVTDLKRVIQLLRLENDVFEKVIMRLEPSLMHGIQQALDYANKLQSGSTMTMGSFAKSTSRFGLAESLISPSRINASPSRVSTRRVESSARLGLGGTVVSGTGPRINVLERSELVSQEIEILLQGLDVIRANAGKHHALLKAQLEEVGIRVGDIENASGMFRQEVIIDGWDKIAQRIPAEIWIRFMTEWVKIADSQIGKLRLRTSTFTTQFKKLNGQIKVKTELSESLRPVDFDKLKIENSECIKEIDQKLGQLAELKKMTGDANLNLSIHKKAMMEQNNYLTTVQATIKKKERLVKELDKESVIIQGQADSLAQKLDEVRKVRMAYEVPDVMDYVRVKSELTDLRHVNKTLENRVHIQQIALTSLNKKLQSMYELME